MTEKEGLLTGEEDLMFDCLAKVDTEPYDTWKCDVDTARQALKEERALTWELRQKIRKIALVRDTFAAPRDLVWAIDDALMTSREYALKRWEDGKGRGSG